MRDMMQLTGSYCGQLGMRRKKSCIVIALTIAYLSIAAGLTVTTQRQGFPPKSRLRLIQHDGSIDVDIDGKIFTTYHFADDLMLPAVRPFVYPVLAADGTEMTIDHAQHPPLHAYQRSVWIGAGDVNGADHWTFKAKPIPKQTHIRFDYLNTDGFQEELIWDDDGGQPMLREIRTVGFIAYPDGARQVNFRLSFTAVSKDVTFFNRRDHGILSVRPSPQIASNPVFTADDRVGECNHHTAWCDESGKINGSVYGIAIFDDPGNPRHPPPWHAGRDQRLATDIFLPRPDFRKDDPDRALGDFTIHAGQTIDFRYGMLFHAGDAEVGKIRERYEKFTLNRRRK